MEVHDRHLPDWLDVSRETAARLEDLADLVLKWTQTINLVSKASLSQIWMRHVLDSAQLWELAPLKSGLWLDVGSGGGFPGIVISILAAQYAPDVRIVMVESDRRKVVFLTEALRHLGLSAYVHCARIETLPPIAAQVVTARALAPLAGLLPIAARHMAANGVALFPKGQHHAEELAVFGAEWVMQSSAIPSKTDPDAAIVRIWDLHHV